MFLTLLLFLNNLLDIDKLLDFLEILSDLLSLINKIVSHTLNHAHSLDQND